MGRGEDGRAQLAAPHLALAEASDILRRASLAGDVSQEEASLAHADLMEIDLELFPFEPFGTRVWELRADTAWETWRRLRSSWVRP